MLLLSRESLGGRRDGPTPRTLSYLFANYLARQSRLILGIDKAFADASNKRRLSAVSGAMSRLFNHPTVLGIPSHRLNLRRGRRARHCANHALYS
jgi:hypothetical protein